MSVEQWLRSFDGAEFVLTDSFHGCIFSIIFQKQFVVMGNKNRGLSRFTSLLEQFSLYDRLLFDVQDYEKKRLVLNRSIDFHSIFDVLNEKRMCSLDYIHSFTNLK